MIWYVLVFILCFIGMILNFCIKDNKKRVIFEIITLIILILFSGTRYKIGGWDYEIYHRIFKWTPYLSEFSLNTTNIYNTEIGYLFLNSIIKTIGFNFYGFTLIHSALFYILLYKGLRKTNINFGFFIIVFLFKSCIFNTFVSMRQSLVIVIFLNSIPYLINNKAIKYLLCIIPCIFIHISSIILIPLVLLRNIKFKKRYFIIYGLICFGFFILNILNIYKFNIFQLSNTFIANNSLISDKISNYSNSQATINIFSTIEIYAIYILMIHFYNKIYINGSREKMVVYNLFMLILPIVTIFRNFEIMIRFRDYFTILEPFILYYIYDCLESKNRFCYVIMLSILCFIGYYRYIYTYDTGDNALKNYKSYLVKDISIFGDE